MRNLIVISCMRRGQKDQIQFRHDGISQATILGMGNWWRLEQKNVNCPSLERLRDDSWSMTQDKAALLWRANGQDLDMPVKCTWQQHSELTHWRSNWSERKKDHIKIYLEFAANTRFLQKWWTSLTSFKQYCSVSNSMRPKNRGLKSWMGLSLIVK